ncbi:MAG: metallophosphoesterase [Clostridia bacterium]|nr:metallophosphoesterase [Clostridia bacterium]
MKILILSDAHGEARKIRRAISLHPDAELILYLGDGSRAACEVFAALPPTVAAVAVHGNCDGPFSGGLRDEEILDIEGHRIFVCHGHRYGVKGGLGHLIAAAKRQGADIALFGHTHERCEEYLPEYGLWLFNPGALAYPERGEPSFGLLTVTPGGLLFSHGEITD